MVKFLKKKNKMIKKKGFDWNSNFIKVIEIIFGIILQIFLYLNLLEKSEQGFILLLFGSIFLIVTSIIHIILYNNFYKKYNFRKRFLFNFLLHPFNIIHLFNIRLYIKK